MNTNIRDFVLPVMILVLATILIAATGADVLVSSCYYIDGKWPIGDQQPWQMLYKLDRIPAIALGLGGLVAAIFGSISLQHRSWVRPGLFFVILLTLGPGLIVNTIFKDHWGRPRPREIVQFGGTKDFLHPWQKGVAHMGRSFPSGHASAAFYMSAPFFIYRRRKLSVARNWLLGGLGFGLLMSAARITQGAHFLSDTLWAWGMVHLVGVALYYLLRLDRDEASSSAV